MSALDERDDAVVEQDQDLVGRFERLEIPPGAFRHRDHVEAAYEMLRKYPFIEATARYARTIQTMAANAGAHTKFHVTVTIALMALVAERMESEPHSDFDDFCTRNGDLFSPQPLRRYYSEERLQSDLARKTFVLPDV